MTLFDSLWSVWKAYIDTYVVENRELKQVLFHSFLGAVLTHKNIKYVESSELKTTRLHTFIVQDSGTGKTQSMYYYNALLDYLGIPSKITIKHNEAALTGTVYESKNGTIQVKEGLFASLYSLAWDEGSVLLKKSPYMETMTDYLQGVMDEPGKVSKGMRLRTIEYNSPTTIVAGSYMFDEFQSTVFTKGCLQRMFIMFKVLSEEEKQRMRIGVNLLKRLQEFEKLNTIRAAIKKAVDKIPTPKNGYVVFNKIDTEVFNAELEKIYRTYVVNRFVGEKQIILETFFNRLHVIIDKIASQKAVIEGRTEVIYDDMMYASNICQIHLNSLLTLFSYIRQKQILTLPEIKQEFIRQLVEQLGNNVSEKVLLIELYKLKQRGRWDLGYRGTVTLLEQLVQNKILGKEKEHYTVAV